MVRKKVAAKGPVKPRTPAKERIVKTRAAALDDGLDITMSDKEAMNRAYESALPVPFVRPSTLKAAQYTLFLAVRRFLEKKVSDAAVNTAWEDIVNWWPMLPEHKEMLLRDNLALYTYMYGAPEPVNIARQLRACPKSDRERLWTKLVAAFRDFPFTEEVEDETPDVDRVEAMKQEQVPMLGDTPCEFPEVGKDYPTGSVQHMGLGLLRTPSMLKGKVQFHPEVAERRWAAFLCAVERAMSFPEKSLAYLGGNILKDTLCYPQHACQKLLLAETVDEQKARWNELIHAIPSWIPNPLTHPKSAPPVATPMLCGITDATPDEAQPQQERVPMLGNSPCGFPEWGKRTEYLPGSLQQVGLSLLRAPSMPKKKVQFHPEAAERHWAAFLRAVERALGLLVHQLADLEKPSIMAPITEANFSSKLRYAGRILMEAETVEEQKEWWGTLMSELAVLYAQIVPNPQPPCWKSAPTVDTPSEAAASTGVKHDSAKLRLELIHPSVLNALGEVLTYGAGKYAPRNYAKGILYSRVYGALLRHLNAWYAGEDMDAESGLPHLHHALTNVAFLVEYAAGGHAYDQFDDRNEMTRPAGRADVPIDDAELLQLCRRVLCDPTVSMDDKLDTIHTVMRNGLMPEPLAKKGE